MKKLDAIHWAMIGITAIIGGATSVGAQFPDAATTCQAIVGGLTPLLTVLGLLSRSITGAPALPAPANDTAVKP